MIASTPERVDTAIKATVARAKREINLDIDTFYVPATTRFYRLHDYVDANEYGGLCENDWYPDVFARDGEDHDTGIQHAATVQRILDEWMQKGRPDD